MVGRQPAHDRRLDIEAACQVTIGEPLPADQHLAVATCLADRLLMPVDGALVDDRTEPVLANDRVAEDDLLGLLDEQPHELVVDRPLDVHARVGRALLAAEPERGSHDPSAASSRSAERVTMAGFLPPISTMHGRGHVLLKEWNSCMPTAYDPVKTMPSTPGWSWRACPTVSPGPMTRLTTPCGTPASM